MEAKKIKIVKDWPKPKSVRNIQVFLGFANFYWQFIQGFSRIAAPLTSILKTTGLPDKSASNRNDGSRSASSKNNNSRPASRKNNGNGEVNGFGVGRNSVKYIKKSEKLFKLRKLKSKKTSKSWNLAKSGKKSLKNENSTNFDTIEDRSKFLTLDARTTFNRLWLAFIEASILWHFDLECHIWIETNALSYAISEVLS